RDRNTKLFTVCGASLANSSIPMSPIVVVITAVYCLFGSSVIAGGLGHCLPDVPATAAGAAVRGATVTTGVDRPAAGAGPQASTTSVVASANRRSGCNFVLPIDVRRAPAQSVARARRGQQWLVASHLAWFVRGSRPRCTARRTGMVTGS